MPHTQGKGQKKNKKEKILFKFIDLEEEKPCTIIPNIYDNKSEQSKIKKIPVIIKIICFIFNFLHSRCNPNQQ